MSFGGVSGAPSDATSRLLLLGIAGMAVAGKDDEPMPKAVKDLRESGRNATALIQPLYTNLNDHAPSKTPMVSIPLALGILEGLIPTLPKDDGCWDSLKATFWGMMIPTMLFLTLRFISRQWVNKRIRRDDWAMLAAFLLCFTLPLVITHKGGENKLCSHIYELSYNQFKNLLLWTYAVEMVYATCIYAVRLALLIFYWDLSPHPMFRRGVMVMFWFSNIILVVAVLSLTFSCKPAAYWRDPIHVSCKRRPTVFMALQSIHVVADIATLLIPVPAVMRLKLRRRDKVSVCLIFGAGTVACLAGLIRMIVMRRHDRDPDFLKRIGFVCFWLLLELCLAISLSCTPAIKMLVTYILFGKRHRKSASHSQSYQNEGSYNSKETASKTGNSTNKSEARSQTRTRSMTLEQQVQRDLDLDDEMELAVVTGNRHDREIGTEEGDAQVDLSRRSSQSRMPTEAGDDDTRAEENGGEAAISVREL